MEYAVLNAIHSSTSSGLKNIKQGLAQSATEKDILNCAVTVVKTRIRLARAASKE